MKILVTGATGFVGKVLARKLVSLGHKVSVLTRDIESAQKRLPLLCEFHKWEPELYPPSSQAFEDVDTQLNLSARIRRRTPRRNLAPPSSYFFLLGGVFFQKLGQNGRSRRRESHRSSSLILSFGTSCLIFVF